MANVSLLNGSGGGGHPTSEASSRQDGTTINYAHPLGTRAVDAAGNEYVYCEAGQQVYSGVVVGISASYAVTTFVDAAHKGAVGVAQGDASSDTGIWVMIRGTTDARIAGADSAATSACETWPPRYRFPPPR